MAILGDDMVRLEGNWNMAGKVKTEVGNMLVPLQSSSSKYILDQLRETRRMDAKTRWQIRSASDLGHGQRRAAYPREADKPYSRSIKSA